jgi:hypothetical protein
VAPGVTYKQINPNAAALKSIILQAGNTLPDHPIFFEVCNDFSLVLLLLTVLQIIADDNTYSIACDDERERDKWLQAIQAIVV